MNEPLTEEEYQQLLQLGSANAAMDPEIERQLAEAQMLRGIPSAQMRNPRGIPVAPGWGEALGTTLAQGVGIHKQNQATEAAKAKTANQAMQNQLMLKALMRQNQQNQPSAGSGLMPPQPQNPYKLGY